MKLENDENEDFIVDCKLESDEDDEELQLARQAIRSSRSFDVKNYESVNECEANNQIESASQGRFASKLYSHLSKEDEGRNDNLNEYAERDYSDWSYASTMDLMMTML